MSEANIFTNYSQQENRFTNGLFSILSLARAEHPKFVSGFFSDLLSIQSSHPFASFRVLKGVPGTVDADVRSADTCVLFETKVASIALEPLIDPQFQVPRHMARLRMQSEPQRRLVLLTPDDGKSNYISQYLKFAHGEIQHLAWKAVYAYLRRFAELHTSTVLAGLIRQFLDTIRVVIFQQDIAGIIQTISLGDKSGVQAREYLDQMRRREWTQWRTPREYRDLSGTCRKLLLYDPKRKAITVEVEVAEVLRTNQESDYPWSNIFTPETLKVLDAPISRDSIRLIPGLEKFGIGPAAYRRITQQVAGNGYRASCGEPLVATAEGATRDEALAKLRADLVARVAVADIVRMTIPTPISKEPVWPDDQFTRDWLEGIAADRAPDPWDLPSDTSAP